MKYYQTIIFTKVPLTGFFRYEEIFQIYPCDLPGAPRSKFELHYPAMLEFWVKEHEHISRTNIFGDMMELDALRGMSVKQDKILSMLTAFTNHIFFRSDTDEGIWGVPMLKDEPGEEANTWSSKWCMPWYHSQDLKRTPITEFTPQRHPDIELVDHFDYYLNNPNLDTDNNQVIKFPATIYRGLESYYAKNTEIQSIVDTAISYVVSSVELRKRRRTMAVLAAFTGVETMVNFEYRKIKPKRCSSCSQPMFKVKQKYRDYMLKYIGDSDSNKRRFNSFYDLRSKIVHTGHRFKTENLFSNVPVEQMHDELVILTSILQMAKLSVVQWLIKNQG